jgi:hypothetical protein
MPFFRQFIAYLMIAVFFNTAIGVPLHAAEHVKNAGAARQADMRAAGQGAGQVAAQAAAQAAASAPSSSELAELTTLFAQDASEVLGRDTPDTRPDAHTAAESCAVCASLNLLVTAFVIWPTAPPVVPAAFAVPSSYVSPAFAAAGQWPFAARDPPRA